MSLVYFTRFGYAAPLATATIFVGVVITMDFFVVAMLINRSLAMFASPIGTWVPFGLTFTSTYMTGRYQSRCSAPIETSANYEKRLA